MWVTIYVSALFLLPILETVRKYFRNVNITFYMNRFTFANLWCVWMCRSSKLSAVLTWTDSSC